MRSHYQIDRHRRRHLHSGDRRGAARDGSAAYRIGDPYRSGYAAKIPPVFAAAGYATVTEAHAGVADNLAYAAIPDSDIVAMVRATAASRPDAVITYCTNFPAAHLVDALERELGIAGTNSVTAGVWGALRLADQTTGPGRRWGSLFELDPPLHIG